MKEEGGASSKAARAPLYRREDVHATFSSNVEDAGARKAARILLYHSDKFRRICEAALKGSMEFKPEYEPRTGNYEYSGVDLGLKDLSPMLEELEKHKIMLKSVTGAIPTCPRCGRPNFIILFNCPYSQHTAIERGTMLEHYVCGYVGLEDTFRVYKDGMRTLICPKCQRALKLVGTDYRKTELSFHCKGCDKFFGVPSSTFTCKICGRVSTEEALIMLPTYTYRLNEELRGEVLSNCNLEDSIVRVFTEHGFKVDAPAKFTGASGMVHAFDLKATRGDVEIVVDLFSAVKSVETKEIAEFFAKVYDTGLKKAILVSIPEPTPEALKLAETYGLELIGAGALESATRTLGETISRMAPLQPNAETLPKEGAPAVAIEQLNSQSQMTKEPGVDTAPLRSEEGRKADGLQRAKELLAAKAVLRELEKKFPKKKIDLMREEIAKLSTSQVGETGTSASKKGGSS